MISNIQSTEYEIHFAAEHGFRPELHVALRDLGFRDDGLTTHGVVFAADDPNGRTSCPLTGLHVTWDSFNREDYMSQLLKFEELLTIHSDGCDGYAHAEVIRPEWDLYVEYHAFDKRIPFPAETFRSGQSNRAKHWDIHISADLSSLEDGLQKVLLDQAWMYFIDLKKRNNTVKRVFTIQGTSSPRQGIKLFQSLFAYLTQAGGMTGSIKFEQTCYWKVCGKPAIVPPVIDSFQLIGATGI